DERLEAILVAELHGILNIIHHLLTALGKSEVIEPQANAVVANLFRQAELVVECLVVVVAPDFVEIPSVRRDVIDATNPGPLGSGNPLGQGLSRLLPQDWAGHEHGPDDEDNGNRTALDELWHDSSYHVFVSQTKDSRSILRLVRFPLLPAFLPQIHESGAIRVLFDEVFIQLDAEAGTIRQIEISILYFRR